MGVTGGICVNKWSGFEGGWLAYSGWTPRGVLVESSQQSSGLGQSSGGLSRVVSVGRCKLRDGASQRPPPQSFREIWIQVSALTLNTDKF